MAIRIGDVWDSATDVLAGRAAMLAPVAALAFFLPAAIQAAFVAYGGTSPGVQAIGALLSLVALAASLWGQLTIIGVASDPDLTRGGAMAAATRRLGPALLVSLVLGAILIVAVLPAVIVLAAGGFDFMAAAAGGSSGPVAPWATLVSVLYSLVLLAGGLWLGGRLFVMSAVVLHERRGIGAIGRSVTLTRGLTARLIGVVLLLLVVYAVAALAAQFITFIVFRLLLGVTQLATATWLSQVAVAIVGAVFSTIVAVFVARLYAALTRPPAPSSVT